jgi:hypothetical protein
MDSPCKITVCEPPSIPLTFEVSGSVVTDCAVFSLYLYPGWFIVVAEYGIRFKVSDY